VGFVRDDAGGGIAEVEIGMTDATNSNPLPPPLRKRRFAIGANVFLQIIAVFALVVMVNWLVSRHYVRLDWTRSHYYELSAKTKEVLVNLKEPIHVIVYLPPRASSDSAEKVLDDVRHLLEEFQFNGKEKFQVEYVDPDRQQARAQALSEQYKFSEPNVVIFVSGPRHKFVNLRDLVELENDPTGEEPPRVKSFKGEGVFLSAIQTVTQDQPAPVSFLTGHGEHDPESFDPRTGYSTLATFMKRDFIELQKWNLQEQAALPTNASAIVIAGPRKSFTEAELNVLDQYLKSRGRLLVLIDPHTKTGLEKLLARWGVQADDDLVMRKAGSLLGTELIDVNAVGTTYASHPVTAKLAGTNTEFPYTRSIRRALQTEAATADQPRVTELVKTPATFWGESDPDTERAVFDPVSDIPGPLSLAAAIETGQPRGANVDIGVTRMIVVGSSGFIDNSSLTGGNLDFFMNALNWLLKRDQMLAVGPKMPQEFRLDMSLSEIRTVYGMVIVGLPMAVGILGLTVWLRRRK
jgi:ABC-type uncharacterized transport system involved in gliding motility auxiliary subunit